MKNADTPAHTQPDTYHPDGQIEYGADGVTKREYACIHCGVPATGDPELDGIIAEGNRIQKAMIDAPAINYGPDGGPDLSKINVES